MSHPTTRVLAMLELLQGRHQLSGAELAAGLGVDQRTVRRYALRLADLGIPVTAERGRYGGYRLLPGYRLPPLMLTDDEAAAVVIGLLAAERLGQPVAGMATALTKIQRVLPAALAERVAALRQTLGFTQYQRKPAVPADTGTVLTLAHAASQRQRVQIRYQSHAETESERDLDPYGLVLHSGRWYVTGQDGRSGQVRTFRVDRVGDVRLTGASFAPPPGFDPVQHVASSLAAVPYTHEVEVILTTSLDAARRRIPPTVGTLTETDDGVLLQARANDLTGAALMLAGLGWPFTVRRPAALASEVRALAARLHAWTADQGLDERGETRVRDMQLEGGAGSVRRPVASPATLALRASRVPAETPPQPARCPTGPVLCGPMSHRAGYPDRDRTGTGPLRHAPGGPGTATASHQSPRQLQRARPPASRPVSTLRLSAYPGPRFHHARA